MAIYKADETACMEELQQLALPDLRSPLLTYRTIFVQEWSWQQAVKPMDVTDNNKHRSISTSRDRLLMIPSVTGIG
jgi:hypothetical protein